MKFTDELVRNYQRSQWLNHGRELNEFRARDELLCGALIYAYKAGTTQPANTFMEPERVTLNPNPVVLPVSGEVSAVFLPDHAVDIRIYSQKGDPIATASNCGPDFEL